MTDFKLVRSNRKSMQIEVNTNLEVVVRAPLFVSQKTVLKFVESRRDWIENAKQRLLLKEQNKKQITLTKADVKRLKKLAEQTLSEKTQKYAELMSLKPAYVKITSAKKRFGSCNSKNGICYSYMLMLYPDEAIDYVVVHELAHIKYKNHSKRFYALIAKILPDYKSREKLLKDYITIKNG